MDEPIEESYFNWLCAKVISRTNPNYTELLRILHSTEFVWVVLSDRNRAEDGIEQREFFLQETQLNSNISWFDEPCSVLEMLVALSIRAAFQTSEPRKQWFWELLTNLKLNEYRRVQYEDEITIMYILERFVWRSYDRDGYGGLFPLRSPNDDQRKVEIWYQFSSYITEQERF